MEDSTKPGRLNHTLLQLAALQRQSDDGLPPPPLYASVIKEKNQLPTYQEVAVSDAPPSYHSLFTDVVNGILNPFLDEEDASPHRTAASLRTHCKVARVCFYSIVFFGAFVFVLGLPLAMIIVGFLYIDRCPAQKKVPLYLVVLGFFQMLESFGRIGYKVFQPQNNARWSTLREKCRRKDPLIYIVIIWFVVGSMWVYQTNPDCINCHENDNSGNQNEILNATVFPVTNGNATVEALSVKRSPVLYCHRVVYNFAFGIITVYYGVIGFFCLLIFIDVVLRAIKKCCCTRHIV